MTAERTVPAVEPTARQLASWVDRGWLNPTRTGKGNPWTWPAGEWAVACEMARLALAGFHHNVAADIARIYVTLGGPVTLAPGLTLHIAPEGKACRG